MEYTQTRRSAPETDKKTGKGFAKAGGGVGNQALLSMLGASDSGGMGDDLRNRFSSGRSLQEITGRLESASGVSLRDAQVHYNSSKPASIQARAYAQGTDVYLGPGQEKYLGHELTHVVQQKQGLVEPTGRVAGMPVNTSPALEGAADSMSVSHAPATSMDAGVVQGVFINPQGNPLGKDDVSSMQKMMEQVLDSAESHVNEKLEDKSYDKPDERKQKHQERDALLAAIAGERTALPQTLQEKHGSTTQYSASDEIHSIMQRAINCLPHSENDTMDLKVLMGNTFLNPDALKTYTGKDAPAYTTPEGFQHTMDGFKLTDKAFDGIQDIKEFNPEKDKAKDLVTGRMGSSTTLAKDLATTPEGREKLAKAELAFTKSTEVARKGAVVMRKSDSVSFSDLMELFMGINTQVRGPKNNGGKIHAKSAGTANSLKGPGGTALPEDLFKTFSFLADSMTKIKAEPDKDLARSQAIQLASFANTMTISAHAFDDGNGRTCRLFADSILQTFGLPPATPNEDVTKAGGKYGADFDFDRAAKGYLTGVKDSQSIIDARPKPSKFKTRLKSMFGSKSKSQPQPAAQPAPAPTPFVPGEKTSESQFGYRSEQMGKRSADPMEQVDVTSADPEQTDLLLRRMYDRIKNPPVGEDPEDTSARKRSFAQLRARQMQEQMGKSKPDISGDKQEAVSPKKQSKKRGFFSRLFGK